MSLASSRPIDARTAESVKSPESTAADAPATAARGDTARFSRAEFTAAYWATLSRVYTRKRNGGGVCAIRRNAAESPAAVAAALAALRLAAASSTNLGTSWFQRTVTEPLSGDCASELPVFACALAIAEHTVTSGKTSSRVEIRMNASVVERSLTAA